ncbi:unnamed protein product [Oikopleura dioica]|uniref:glycine--tRNA ligase n=1 Tax=Oikopleura dioica TaxID=34765 RepID=E4X809_OIKDI|nr:unnamed protein product [Oikopleura dioica]
MYKCGCGVKRFLGLSGRFQAVAPKNSKSEVLLGEAKRRELETLRRQRRFELWTLEGQNLIMQKLGPIQENIRKQANSIKKMKQDENPYVKDEISVLKKMKKELEELEKQILLAMVDDPFDSVALSQTVKNRFIYAQSGEIYGGGAGLYDFGPLGSKLKNNVIREWKNVFVDGRPDVFEVDTTIMTPERVLQGSGHTEKFADLMVKEISSGEFFRTDQLLSSQIQKEKQSKKSKYSAQELENDLLLKKFSTWPRKNFSPPTNFKLMFSCKLGPDESGENIGFLRPETSQGVYSVFQRLLQHNNSKLPFSVAQVGTSFRNEIKASGGLLRCREFQMMELQHFHDPQAGIDQLSSRERDQVLPVLSREAQISGGSIQAMSVKNILLSKMVSSPILASYLVKTFDFLMKLGIDQSKMRFRQQLDHELAHYAKDCWDLEIMTRQGWVECGGLADRGSYDLKKHADASGANLMAQRQLASPKQVKMYGIKIKSPKKFKKTPKVLSSVKNLDQTQIAKISESLSLSECIEIEGVELKKSELVIKEEIKNIQVESFFPEVIEPSFGLGRILSALLEHSFQQREVDGRKFFTFPPSVAPYKASVMTIINMKELDVKADAVARLICEELSSLSVDYRVDTGGKTIGRKYSLNDEIGVPYGIVIDFDTFRYSPATVSIRDRDTLSQLRVNVKDVASFINQLSTQEITFAMAEEKYLFQEEFLDSPDQFELRENFKRATNGVKYSERDVGKLLASLADVAVQLGKPELLMHIHSFKREMN